MKNEGMKIWNNISNINVLYSYVKIWYTVLTLLKTEKNQLLSNKMRTETLYRKSITELKF